MISRRLLIFVVALVVAISPSLVHAHERWFVAEPYPPTDWSALASVHVTLALMSAIAVVTMLAVLQRRIGDPLWPRPRMLQRLEIAAPAILGVQTAITLMYEATQMHLFAPNIDLSHTAIGYALAGVAVIAGFTFVTGMLTRIGAAVTIALLLVAFAYAPIEQVLEQALFAGIAFYLVAVGRGVIPYDGQEEDRTATTDRLLPHALTILRISAGLSILILAFTEKLLNARLGIEFLQEYPYFNIAREAGVTWFTDERFVYAAGIVEATAGAALLFGFLPRVVILALWIPFNLGIAFLPAQELIGHLPIVSTMYVLLVRGTEGIPPLPVDSRRFPAQRPAVEVTRPAVGAEQP